MVWRAVVLFIVEMKLLSILQSLSVERVVGYIDVSVYNDSHGHAQYHKWDKTKKNETAHYTHISEWTEHFLS